MVYSCENGFHGCRATRGHSHCCYHCCRECARGCFTAHAMCHRTAVQPRALGCCGNLGHGGYIRRITIGTHLPNGALTVRPNILRIQRHA